MSNLIALVEQFRGADAAMLWAVFAELGIAGSPPWSGGTSGVLGSEALEDLVAGFRSE